MHGELGCLLVHGACVGLHEPQATKAYCAEGFCNREPLNGIPECAFVATCSLAQAMASTGTQEAINPEA